MTARGCPRQWEAEAVHDGRLDGRAASSFERHLSSCATCTAEFAALQRIRELAAACDARRLSPLEQRRGRLALLRAANRRAIELGRERRPWRAVFALTLAAATFAGLWSIHHTGTPLVHGRSDMLATAPSYELRPIDGATWSDRSAGAFSRVALARGGLSVHVEHLRPGQRFVVSLPDGQLEVRGTRFVVEAERGATQRVTVTEGVVELRLAGEPERRLVAGEHWSRSDDRVRADVKREPDTELARLPRPEQPGHAPHAGVGTGAPHGEARRNAPARDDSRDRERSTRTIPLAENPAAVAFAAAMNAFSSAAYRDAEERFAEFTARFPGDQRCEDATFLRAVIAVRCGERDAARRHAQTYLRRFPSGLRRRELAGLVDAGPLADVRAGAP